MKLGPLAQDVQTPQDKQNGSNEKTISVTYPSSKFSNGTSRELLPPMEKMAAQERPSKKGGPKNGKDAETDPKL